MKRLLAIAVCNTTKPATVRAHVSGMRANNFGDLVFVYHAEFTTSSGQGSKKKTSKYLLLLELDAASSLL